ncbi:MAG: rod shape-determining protein RodA [Bacteroidales bacterium]|nr:rod shape-determining protein RodA [Bacteroidales bacterium]
MTEKLHIEDIDWITIILYLVLVVFGWLNIFAVSYNERFRSIFDLSMNYGDQLIWILTSFVMIILLFAVDHRSFYFFAYPVYGFAIVLLLAVVLFGTEVNNARSWFRIFGVNFQPSEFAKLATALALARFLSGWDVKIRSWKSMVTLLMMVGVPAMIIAVQPDWGTALVFSGFVLLLYREGMPGWMAAMILFLAGLFLFTLLLVPAEVIIALIAFAFIGFAILSRKAKHIVAGGAIFGAFLLVLRLMTDLLSLDLNQYQVILITLVLSTIVYLIMIYLYKLKRFLLVLAILFGSIAFTFTVDYMFHNFLKPHQQMRINILLGKETDIQDVGYNLNQSKIAIGSGGFMGKGFLKGTQTKLNFVPEQSTDFIFCTIGEEWGFVGTTLVIAVFVGLLIRLIFLAERQKSNFARIYGYGVLSVIFFHFSINIAMTIGLFPVIGIPLPFFSYGGSAFLAFTLMLFIFIRLDSVRKVYVI